jgi:hypothetical protein
MKTRCTATTRAGRPCRAWAVAGTDPPRCAPHGGGARPVGAPPNNRNAEKHGMYSVSTPERSGVGSGSHAVSVGNLSADLADRLGRFGDSIEERAAELTLDQLARLLDTYSQAIGRLARIRRLEQQLHGAGGDELARAVDWTLDTLSEQWDLQL